MAKGTHKLKPGAGKSGRLNLRASKNSGLRNRLHKIKRFRLTVSMSATAIALIPLRTNRAVRWTRRGTHQGEFMGVAPTGRHVTFTGMRLFRIAENEIAESWVNIDERGLQEQLGTVPG
jgi:predicted ester cyclase